MRLGSGDKILFMKVGTHASESLSDIVARKRLEIEREGFALWGYGGNTCNPTSMVQPFATNATGPIVLAMQPMTSNHFAEPIRAEEYSDDGVHWGLVPPGINCVGSRFALVIDSLLEVDDTIDLGTTRVGVGPSLGRAGSAYIQGRVDKACLEVTDQLIGEPRLMAIGYRANILKPYAVYLRN